MRVGVTVLLAVVGVMSGCGEDPVASSARDLGAAALTISGELEGRSLRGTGAVDLPRDAVRLELAVSAAGLEHARGEGVDAVMIGDRLFERGRFTEYDDHGELSQWQVSPRTRHGFDPAALLRALRHVEGAEEIGKEQIRERPATRYEVTIRHPSGPRQPADVWIDARDRIVRYDVGDISMFLEHRRSVRIEAPDTTDARPDKPRD